ncbi:MAG: hypothetical protein CVU39_01490 [Chloroflexi bacterium HGW-Chloroflexi-10]|nr:MAG: hypothetical protein CVU39_01490 [Chloroflexi bacterium HGW-Chloroflexi-10]
MASKKLLPVIFFESQTDWEAWLEDNQTVSPGVWVKMAKKTSGIVSLDYPQALESALCYGWIDGQKNSFDDIYWLQHFTQRRPRSNWSKINCEKVTELIARGRMKPGGMKVVEEAKRDGRWEAAYAPQRDIAIPADFLEKLAENPVARAFFDALDKRNRYIILYEIENAKKQETRIKRIEKFIVLLNAEKKLI